MSPRPRRQAGFSLVEMIVVLAILGMVLGFVGLHRPVRSARLELEEGARALAGALQLARARAIAENRGMAVTIGPSGYAIDGQVPRKLPPRVMVAEAGTIRFAADGSASGGVVLLRAEDQAVRLDVSWLTGRITGATLR